MANLNLTRVLSSLSGIEIGEEDVFSAYKKAGFYLHLVELKFGYKTALDGKG